MSDQDMKDKVDVAMGEMLDCFGGADGGTTFVKLRMFMETMVERSGQEGSEAGASKQLCEIVIHMGNLINYVKRS